MKKVEKIKDFIHSFFYYPKMKRYFRECGIEQYDEWKSAIKYAWWHCHVEKLSYYLNKQTNNMFENEEWKPIYKQEPIEKIKLEEFEDGKPLNSGIWIPHHEGAEYVKDK